jgi:hypothetical protein
MVGVTACPRRFGTSVFAIRNLFRFLPGGRLKPGRFFDALGEYAWVGYALVWLFSLTALLRALFDSEGQERGAVYMPYSGLDLGSAPGICRLEQSWW